MMKKKKYLIVIAAILCACFVFAACQPTPEVAPVVNKREEVPKDAIKEEGGDTASAISYDPVEYEVTETWTETITRDENFVINVDADVLMPKVEKYPVERVERAQFTQEQVDKMIDYFVEDGSKFYKYPLPTTKKYYEAMIVDYRKQIADAEANGYSEDVVWMEEEISYQEEQMAKAPETAEKEYTDTKFTYQLNWETYEPDTEAGENFINVAIENPDGSSTASVWATKFTPMYYYGPDFGYSSGMYEAESWFEDREKYLVESEEWINEIEDEKQRAEEQAYVDKERAYVAGIKAGLEKNNMDLDAAKQQAIAMLEEFGITGVQVTKCEKALAEKQPIELEYEYTNEWEPFVPKNSAVMIEFVRQCGGIPCAVSNGGGPTLSPEERAGTYSAPFWLETGSIVIDESGEVITFYWNSGAQVVETVAADSELIPFKEVQKRAMDQLYYNNTYWLEDMEPEEREKYKRSLRFDLDKVELKMTYINAKDDPDRVLVVPVWCFGLQGHEKTAYDGEEEYEYDMGYQEIFISALDGSVILEPGLDRQYEEEQKWQAEEEQKLADEEGGDNGEEPTPAPVAA